jgi:hypothetical protein
MHFSSALSFLLAGSIGAIPIVSESLLETSAAIQAQADYLERLSKRQTTPLNNFLSLVASLFPFSIAIADIDDAIATAEQALASALGIDTTENGLAGVGDGNGCADITIIFARGTTEAGNVGALVGPPFFDAVKKALGPDVSLAIQGVDYPASVPGFLAGGERNDSQQM